MSDSLQLPDETYEFIKGEAVDCVVRFEAQYPLDGLLLASRMGIDVVKYSDLTNAERMESISRSESGYCKEVPGGAIIYLNDTTNPAHQKTTVLHEIGHIKLDHMPCAEFDRDVRAERHDLEQERESEANFFAKYINAPPPLIAFLPMADASSIRKAFGLSFEASLIAESYFLKWKEHFNGRYKDYEERLLRHCGEQFSCYLKQSSLLR